MARLSEMRANYSDILDIIDEKIRSSKVYTLQVQIKRKKKVRDIIINHLD